MPVNPIDYGRYGHQEMVHIFEEEFRHQLWLMIEADVAQAQAELKIIPKEAANDIANTAKPEIVTLSRTMEIESSTRHDVAALFEAIAEKCNGEGARWVHFGLTSNDVKDTALALQLKNAYKILIPQVDLLCKALAARAHDSVDIVAVGRSHGQHAVPITYGLRFAVWLDELLRHRERLLEAQHRAIVGKIAGATGSHAALGKIGLELQQKVMERLGLNAPIATTQIVQRDRLAESILTLANLAASIEKFATNVRNLQRTEIGEVFEPFAKGKQVGSSAMPHKRNPVSCEKITGIARYARSLVSPALENVTSWEERDITHSSTERFVVPQAFILVDYLVREMTRVVNGLEIDTTAIERNLVISNEAILSEYILTQLTKSGLERPKAHNILRDLSVKAKEQETTLLNLVKTDENTKESLKGTEIDIDSYLDSIRETSKYIVENAVKRYKEATE